MAQRLNGIILSSSYQKDAYNIPGRQISIKVDRETFKTFPVFDTIKFNIKGKERFGLVDIRIPGNDPVYYYIRQGDTITSAEIIHSKSNPNKPLVYGITSGIKTTYYKQSSVTNRGNYNVLGNHHIGDVADALIEENDYINGMVTFRLDQKAKYNNIGEVVKKSIGSNYEEYTHKPKITGGYNLHNALVINKVDGTDLPIEFTGDSPIKIHDNKLESISVYFYEFGAQNNIPLMIKVKIGSEEHFYTPTTGHDETWVKVDHKDFSGGTDNKVITNYLTKIKKRLFDTVYVLIHKQQSYKMLTLDDHKNSKGANTVPDSIGKPGSAVPAQGYDDPNTDKSRSTGKRKKRRRGHTNIPRCLNPKNTICVKRMECSPELGDYVCFQHDLNVHKGATQQGRDKHEVGYGAPKYITVYISNVDIKIHLKIMGGLGSYISGYGHNNLEELTDLMFLDHMPTLNVFFYGPNENIEERIEGVTRGNSGKDTNSEQGVDNKSRPDNIPLMFNYNNHWFKPPSINKYFVEWTNVDELVRSNPCEKEGASRIKTYLDEVNRMLNRINLNFNGCSNSNGSRSMTGMANRPSVRAYAVVNSGRTSIVGGNYGSDPGGKGVVGTQASNISSSLSGHYGIPKPSILNPSFNVNRIIVTCTPFENDKMFISYTHKTKNRFYIGSTWYRTKEKEAGGPEPGHLRVSQSLVQQISQYTRSSDKAPYIKLYGTEIRGIVHDLDGMVDVTAQSVTVYFFNEDKDNNYPLLAEYKGGDKKYQYYVLKHAKDETIQVTTS